MKMGSKMNAVAAVMGIVAVVATYISGTMNVDNQLPSLVTCIVAAVAGIVLCVAGIVTAKNDLVRSVAGLGGIAAFMFMLYNIISDRVMLIAGLFSYNAGNTEGWKVFYVTIVAVAGILLACFSLIAGAFMNTEE